MVWLVKFILGCFQHVLSKRSSWHLAQRSTNVQHSTNLLLLLSYSVLRRIHASIFPYIHSHFLGKDEISTIQYSLWTVLVYGKRGPYPTQLVSVWSLLSCVLRSHCFMLRACYVMLRDGYVMLRASYVTLRAFCIPFPVLPGYVSETHWTFYVTWWFRYVTWQLRDVTWQLRDVTCMLRSIFVQTRICVRDTLDTIATTRLSPCCDNAGHRYVLVTWRYVLVTWRYVPVTFL